MNTLLWSLFFCHGENKPDIQTAPPPTDQGGLPKLISFFSNIHILHVNILMIQFTLPVTGLLFGWLLVGGLAFFLTRW